MSFLREFATILSCSNINKSPGKKHILKQAPFHPGGHERATVVGVNGTGKSISLRIIIRELISGEGYMALGRGVPTGYLAQHQDLDSKSIIYDALLEVKWPTLQMKEYIHTLELDVESAFDESLEIMLEEYSCLTHQFELGGGYIYCSGITGVLEGLGFVEEGFPKPINALSGGRRTRVSLDKSLLTKPDVLLPDEPTDHLDMESTAWLETYLKTYSGSAIIVAHGRYFLDRVVTRIVELDNGTGTVFSSNHTVYNDKKAVFRDARIRAYLNQQQETRHQEAAIVRLKSFNREKPIRKAGSREKMLERINRLEKSMDIDDSMDIRLEPDVENGKDMPAIIGLSKSFDSQTLFTDVNFETKREERVAIIGNSGIGKTTLLKTINQPLPIDAGEIRLDSKVYIGYYDQEHQALHIDKTLFDKIQDTYPNMNNTQIRNTLTPFLFIGDDVSRLIRGLSSGKRGRTSLAKLILPDANSLLLDELTNHLDIASKEILESALCRYAGTALHVFHDRYPINHIAARILDLIGQSLISYIGSYDYYLEKKDVAEAAFATRNKRMSSAPNFSQASGRPSRGSQNNLKLEWEAQEEERARIRRIQNKFKKTGDSVYALETRDSKIDALLIWEEVYTDVSRSTELSKEKEEIAGQLEKLYQSWEESAEKV